MSMQFRAAHVHNDHCPHCRAASGVDDTPPVVTNEDVNARICGVKRDSEDELDTLWAELKALAAGDDDSDEPPVMTNDQFNAQVRHRMRAASRIKEVAPVFDPKEYALFNAPGRGVVPHAAEISGGSMRPDPISNEAFNERLRNRRVGR